MWVLTVRQIDDESQIDHLEQGASMPRRGRDLEVLVQEIEKAFSGTSAEVKSPDYIPGKLTGTLREIDISVRAKVGSTSALAILECRKRAKRQDSTWISELAVKAEDVGANCTVAVSSTSFTAGAKSLAKAKGIELRTLTEISVSNLLAWLFPAFQRNRHFNVAWTNLEIELGRPAEAGEGYEPTRWHEDDRLDDPLFRLPDGSTRSLHDIFFFETTMKLAAAMPADLSEWAISASRDFTDSPVRYVMATPYGNAEVLKISAEFRLTVEVRPIVMDKQFEYSGPDGTLSHTAVASEKVAGLSVMYRLHVPADQDHAIVQVERTDQNSDMMLAVGFPLGTDSASSSHTSTTL
jgi:hypothetical protein